MIGMTDVRTTDPSDREIALKVAEAIHLALRREFAAEAFLSSEEGRKYLMAAWSAIFTYEAAKAEAEQKRRFTELIASVERQGDEQVQS
jgi:hypothetical protein